MIRGNEKKWLTVKGMGDYCLVSRGTVVLSRSMDKLRTLTDLSGSVLDLASGPFSLGSLYRDAGAVQHFLIAFTFRRLLDDGSTTALSVS